MSQSYKRLAALMEKYHISTNNCFVLYFVGIVPYLFVYTDKMFV